MTYFNNLGQGRIGWRSPGGGVTPSTLWTSVFGVWNADALGTSLDTSIYGVYNGDNVNDTSGNARNGTNVNNVTFTTGKVGNAFTFNGSNNINLPNSSFDFTGDFSISTWVKIPSAPVSESGGIFRNDNYDVATSYGYALYVRTTKEIGFYIGSINGTSTVISTTVLALNTWYHITVKRDSVTKTSYLYINGTLEAQATNTNLTIDYGTRAIQPAIGAYRGNNQGVLSVSNYLNGSVDALTIWNKKLTDSEITSLYNGGNGAEYPFSSQTLPTYNDATPNANHGTTPASTNTNGVPGPSFTTGKIGKAFNFDGINDYISLPTNSLNLTGNYSMNLWLYLPSAPNSTLLSVFGNDGTNKGFYIDLTNSTSYTFRFVGFNNGNVTIALNASGNPGYLSRWSMATLTVSGTSVKVYLDGSLVSSGVMSSPINYIGTTYPTLGAFRIGNGSPSGYLANGTKIDALSVWNKELTSNEVTELYNSGNGKQYPN